jgi:hypothetical protein
MTKFLAAKGPSETRLLAIDPRVYYGSARWVRDVLTNIRDQNSVA